MIDYPSLDTSAPTFPSEADLVHLMCRHIPYIEQYWVHEDEEHGYFGTLDVNEFQPPGGPINEMIIRSLGDELRGYAALHQSAFFDPTLAGIEKPVLLDRLNRCLRWICAHHLSGPRRTEPFEWNGQWGDDWESSLWIADIAMAANHVANELAPDVLEAVHRVLAFEADRFLGVDPPDGRWHDTKEEENAWDSYLLAWAHCLLPDHPHADGRIRQSIAIIALEDGETSLVIDWTVSDVALSLNEGFGVYIMNDFVNGNRIPISFEGGRRTIRGVGGRARVIETGSTWIKIAGCLGIETSGEQLLYEDAAERNTPERWRNLLQDRVFLRPEVNSGTVRDYACVIRQGRAGTRRTGHGVERLQTAQDGIRAYRFRSRTSDVIAVANFTPVSRSVELAGRSIDVPAMDTVLMEN